MTVTADGSTCKLHVFVTAFTKFSNCDRAQDLVTKLGVSFKTENIANSGDKVNLTIGSTNVEGFDAGKWNAAFLDAGYPNLQRDKDGKIMPKPADAAKINWFVTELILVMMVGYAAMVYGPVAAFLVELFPTRIVTRRCRCRITSELACSAACCRCSPLLSWPQPEISTMDCGIRSRSPS